jgi:hypothetical protein
MRVVAWKRPFAPTVAYTAGTPAKAWVRGNAREMIVTASPRGQSPAEPLM